jgi:hypothetical protein
MTPELSGATSTIDLTGAFAAKRPKRLGSRESKKPRSGCPWLLGSLASSS